MLVAIGAVGQGSAVGRGSARAAGRDVIKGHCGVLVPRLGRSLALPRRLTPRLGRSLALPRRVTPLIKSTECRQVFLGFETKMDLFEGNPGDREGRNLIFAEETNGACFQCRLGFACLEPAEHK